MSNKLDWAEPLIVKVQKNHASITKAAISRVELLLKTQFSERPIPPAELKTLAQALLTDMSPEPKKGD